MVVNMVMLKSKLSHMWLLISHSCFPRASPLRGGVNYEVTFVITNCFLDNSLITFGFNIELTKLVSRRYAK